MVGLNGKLGFIDKSGKEVIPPKYDAASDFSEGLAAVRIGDRNTGKWGFIDKSGNEIAKIAFEFSSLGDVSEGLVRFSYGNTQETLKYGFIALPDSIAEPIAQPAAEPAAQPQPTAPQKATPSAATVFINNEQVSFDAYNISGTNYFKLRDLAFALSGSAKQFDVAFDSAANAISLIPNNPYTVAGGEMAAGDGQTKNATPTASKILLDGKEVSFEAYNIGGNNYFKLRDVGSTFDFATDWDAGAGAIMIDTSKPYKP